MATSLTPTTTTPRFLILSSVSALNAFRHASRFSGVSARHMAMSELRPSSPFGL